MNRFRWIRSALVGAALPAVLTSSLRSQDSTANRAPWLAALSVGFPVVDGDASLMLFTVGGNFTKIWPGRLSPDISIGTMPYALSFGVIPWGVRTGLALPMQANRDLYIVPSAGVSMLGVIGFERAGVIGMNSGLALVTRTGTRFGITGHRLSETGDVMLVEIGVGRLKP